VIDEPGEYELVADLAPDSLDQKACIIIDSDGVTLQGNGHTIDVSDTLFEPPNDYEWPYMHSCIAVNSSGPDVYWTTAVHDVVVQGGDIGIYSPLSGYGEYTDITAVENNYGFDFYANRNTLNNCVIEDSDVGVSASGDDVVYGGSDVTLEYCTIRDSVIGIWTGHASRADVTATRILDNGIGLSASRIANAVTIEDSHICRNEDYGVWGHSDPGYPGDEPPMQAEVTATDNYWGAANGPSSFGNPEEPFVDPETGRPADGDGDAISQGLEPGVSNVRFDPFRESTLDDIGASR
jgi:hypothetical protein